GVLGIAAMYAGVPYEWGGTTPSGFDCSGFTQYVFSKIGISLPRTAEEQRMAATRVSNPQPGDLVFFGSPAHHVGIYAGGGMMWDAPHSGAVVSKRAIWTSDVTYGRFS
ncbi:MAG: C40 family peptidase, partial [Oryzihumus sp.]